MAEDTEWMVVKESPRRRQRNKNYRRSHNNNSSSSNRRSKEARKNMGELTVSSGSAATSLEDFQRILETCQRQLLKSDFYEDFRVALQKQSSSGFIREIVCYGIGNFYTKRPSGPLWQISMALLIRDHGNVRVSAASGAKTNGCTPMAYFEPLMTDDERLFLESIDVHVIANNERACRKVLADPDSQPVLFFMPHCGVSLYTNLLYTNWDRLSHLVIFGNSLESYLERCDEAGYKNNFVSEESFEILQALQPYWVETMIPTSKRDEADQPNLFWNAFNNSGLIGFPDRPSEAVAYGWPERPASYTTMVDNSGEIL